MRTPSLDLFNLIKSLNTQEKVHFKIFASRKKSGSDYVKLFNCIDGQKIYDEAAIKKKLKNEPLIKNFDNAKAYVSQAILKCLQEYYSSDSIEAELCNYIQQIEILSRKCLFVAAKKIIQKAEVLAVKHHQHLYLLIILSWKRKVLIAGLYMEEIELYQNELYIEESHNIELQKNLTEYKKLYTKISVLAFRKFDSQDDKTIGELEKILKSPLLKNDSLALSSPAKVLYYRILGEVHLLLQNPERCYFYFKKATGFFESARLSASEMINIYSRAMVLVLKLKKVGELEFIKNAAVNLFESLPKKTMAMNLSRQYHSIILNYIDFQLSIGNVQQALIQSDNIRKSIENYASIQGFMIYYANLSTIAFYMKDFRQALNHANKALANEKAGVRKDVLASLKIQILAIHYELGNENILPDLCRSLGRYLEMIGGLHEIEKIILNFFGKTILKVSSQNEKIKAFRNLKKELDSFKTNKILESFDYISWAESKIKNKAFVDVIKEKMN